MGKEVINDFYKKKEKMSSNEFKFWYVASKR